MKDKIIGMDKEKIADMADKYFQRICGDAIEGEQKDVFLTEIKNAREHVLFHMKPMAVCSYYGILGKRQPAVPCGEVSLQDDRAFFSGKGMLRTGEGRKACFQGGVFRYYGQYSVNGIVTYLLTIGDLHKSGLMKLLQQYYIDAWGSAYVEAAHDLLQAELTDTFRTKQDWQGLYDDKKYFISQPFGPGYFGIAVEDTKKIFELSAYEMLQLSLSEGGMMKPEKSCSGFYVLSEEEIPFPEDHCASCKAKTHCTYCRKKNV